MVIGYCCEPMRQLTHKIASIYTMITPRITMTNDPFGKVRAAADRAIVQRFRALLITGGSANSLDIEQAADAIERLRARVAELENGLQGMTKWFGGYPEWVPAHEHMHKVYAAIETAKTSLGERTDADTTDAKK